MLCTLCKQSLKSMAVLPQSFLRCIAYGNFDFELKSKLMEAEKELWYYIQSSFFSMGAFCVHFALQNVQQNAYTKIFYKLKQSIFL